MNENEKRVGARIGLWSVMIAGACVSVAMGAHPGAALLFAVLLAAIADRGE